MIILVGGSSREFENEKVNRMNIEVQEYKSWIDKFINRNDNREINYQNDVVKRLLECSWIHR